MRGLRFGHGSDVRCTSDCCVRGGLGVSPSGLQWAVLCCSLRLGADGRDVGGDAVSPGSGAEHSTPQSAGPPQKGTQAPGSPPLLSEPCFHSARIRAPFDFVFLSQTVVPKIANLRNHQEADSDANTCEVIYKLDLVSKYTQHFGAGTWAQRRVLA